LLRGGQYTSLDFPNALTTAAFGINASGQIVGYYIDTSSALHGFLLSGGHYTTLDDPVGVQGTVARGINASSVIVGYSLGPYTIQHGFRLSAGNYLTLDDPNGFHDTSASGINDYGQIVGVYFDHNRAEHGFLRHGDQYLTLDDPNAMSRTEAQAINDSANVVGLFFDANGVEHAFLATPTLSSVASTSTAASVSLAPALQPASGTDFAPLASSLLNARQPSVPASPLLGSATLPAPRPSSAIVLAPAGTTAALPAGAADAVFAVSHATTHDEAAWVLAPLASTSLDVI
jgi:probable HAF family extracellular repeat protein